MSRRRSRYTVIAVREGQPPENKVILAYDAQGAVSYYTQLGYTVIKVQKGDYRREARHREIKSKGGYRLDRTAVERAKQEFGLRLPIKIRFDGRVGGTGGNHRLRVGYHDIMLKSWLTPDQASEYLWHELKHAQQAERFATREEWHAYCREQKRYPYRIRPIEIEARQAQKMAETHPLAR